MYVPRILNVTLVQGNSNTTDLKLAPNELITNVTQKRSYHESSEIRRKSQITNGLIGVKMQGL